MTGRAGALDSVPGLRELAIAQHGVVRRDQLAVLGVTHQHVRTQRTAERWTTYGPRVVVLKSGRLSLLQRRCVAALHAGPRAVVAGRTSLELGAYDGRLVIASHVLVPHGLLPPPLPGMAAHQSRHLDPCDIDDAVWPPRTTPARSAVDAASWERNGRSACGLVVAVAQRGIATAGQMLDVIERLGPVRHRKALIAVLGESADGAESVAESDAATMMRQAGLGVPRRQVVVPTSIGPRPVDLVAELPDGRMLAVEVDGPHHLDPQVRAADLAKDAALLAAGYAVIRIPVWLLRQDPAAFRAQLRAIVEAARRRTASGWMPDSVA